MTASVHLATGAAGALLAQNILFYKYSFKFFDFRILIAFVVGILSHLVFDSVPHAEYYVAGFQLFEIVFLEVLVMMFILVAMSDYSRWAHPTILFGMFGAAFPDVLGMVGRLLGLKVLIWSYDVTHLWHGQANLFFAGYWIQFMIVAACIVYARFEISKSV